MDDSIPDLWRHRGDLDIALLRTFVSVIDLGGVAQAARHIGRSQPAASLQLKRLQDDLGVVLLRKAGRRLELTDAGEKLAPLARRLIRLHDQTLAAVAEDQLSGRVRIGAVEDMAEDWLTAVVSRFSAVHPSVSVEVHTARRASLLERFLAGSLDLLITLGDAAAPEALDLGTVPIRWIGSEGADWTATECVPLVLLDGDCRFRKLATASLEASGRSFRVAFTSHAVSTQWSAVRAGIGISLRTPLGIRRPLTVLDEDFGLPAIDAPPLHVLLYESGKTRNRPAEHLKALLLDALSEQLRAIGAAGQPTN